MKPSLWLLGTGLVIALLIPLLLGGTDLAGPLSRFPIDQLMAMLGIIVGCWNINALRLRLLLAGRAGRMTQPRALAMIMATEFAICATPGGSGGPITLLGLLSRHGVTPPQATAIFAADQLSDLLFFLLALFLTALYATSALTDPRLGWLILASLVMLGTGLVILGLWLRHTSRFMTLSGRWLSRLRLPRRWRFGLARRVLQFRMALMETLQLPRRRLALVLLLCALHWLLRYSVLYLAIIGLGEHVAWAWTFLIQMLSMAAGQLSMLPGGAGGAELTSTGLLLPLIGASHAAAAVLVWRFVTYYFYLLAGAPVFILLLRRYVLTREKLT